MQKKVEPNIADNGLKILAELLRYFREKKEMSVLMLCTKIEKIEIENSIAKIYFDNYNSEIKTNEEFIQKLKEFFEVKHLGMNIIEKEDEFADQKELSKLLGGKLIIK